MATPFRVVTQPGEAGAFLPQNIEAEAALLGALMIDNRLVEDVQLKLRSEHFFEPLHGRIYDTILRMIDRNLVANPVTLRPMFEADEAMRELGGPAYLAGLTDSGAAIVGARDFASQIYDLALLRALVEVGRDMVEGALDTSEEIDPQNRIEAAEIALYKVAEQGDVSGGVQSFAQAAKLAVDMADKALKSGGHLSGVTTGLKDLNAKIGGLHNSDLVVLAGRPGMGKTALATNIAFNAAYQLAQDREAGVERSSGASVAFFSLEMSADQLATRILAEQSGITSEQLRTGKIDNHDFRKLARAAADLETLPLYIDDTAGLTIASLRTRARRLKRQRGIGMIVIDYLQLVTGTSRQSDSNRVQEVSEVTRGLKQLAKELQVPVLALSQLSRAVENREDKRPQLADLRESGTIEQDADMVLFIYREEYYVAMREPKRPRDTDDPSEDPKVRAEHDTWWQSEMEPVYGRAELIVSKQRHGSTGKINLGFKREVTKFTDLADEHFLPERRN
jgi:replicative DNA helicase